MAKKSPELKTAAPVKPEAGEYSMWSIPAGVWRAQETKLDTVKVEPVSKGKKLPEQSKETKKRLKTFSTHVDEDLLSYQVD